MPGPVPQTGTTMKGSPRRSMSLQNVVPTGLQQLNYEQADRSRRHTVGEMDAPSVPLQSQSNWGQPVVYQPNGNIYQPPVAQNIPPNAQSPTFRRRQFDPTTHETVHEHDELIHTQRRGSVNTENNGIQPPTPESGAMIKEQRSNTLSSGVTSDAAEDDDTVNVVVRVRPLSVQEAERKDKHIIQFPGEGGIWIDTGFSTKSFTFNVTFEAEARQADVFEHSGVKKLIEMALNGYSCTAFAFGQTGSGKTHTITGPPELFQDGRMVFSKDEYGLIPRSFHYLFHLMKQQPRTGFRITASYLEIYNEQVMDLLNPNQRRNLMVRWSKNKGFYVENLFNVQCESVDDLLAVLEEGLRNRATGSNSVNEHSSRSHSMLSLHIDSDHQDPDDENLYITKHGKLTFVDLAGSEKTKTDGKSDQSHMLESNNINRSLLVLGNCISSLSDAKKRGGHIPYRDSKLTKLLADSLGGNGVTLMIACVSPSGYNGGESMNTLRYANRAKKIKSKPVIKMDPREKLIMSLKREVKVLRQENHYLRQQLEFPVKPRGQLQKENDEKFLRMLKDQGVTNRGADGGLYEMLQEYMIENEILRNENSDLHQSRDQGKHEQQGLARENERLMRHMDNVQHGQMVGGTHRSMDGTPVSMYSLNSTSRKSSADPRADYYGSPGGTPPSYRHPQPITTPRGGGHGAVNGVSSSPRMPHHQKRPPHRLTEPVNKSNPAFIDTTQRNGHPHYQQAPTSHPLPGGPSHSLPGGPSHPLPGGPSHPLPGGPSHPLPGGPSGPPSPQRPSRGSQHQTSTGAAPSPRKPRGPPLTQGPFKNASQPPPPQHNNFQHQTPQSYESQQQVNDRLRQELLSIEGEIRDQSQLNSPQASSRWEHR